VAAERRTNPRFRFGATASGLLAPGRPGSHRLVA
jgi:hypothetical protein